MLTKKAKVERYDEVASERDLLQLYLHDTQSGVEPIVVRKGDVRANLYRATGASGGYVVIRTTDGQSCNTSIALFDDAYRIATQPNGWATQEDLDYRTVLERCRIERDKAINAKEHELLASR